MTLAEAVAALEAEFTPVDGLPCAFAQTGERYTEFAIFGHGSEGMTLDIVIHAWLAAARQYAAHRKGKLYWRIRPEYQVEHRLDGDNSVKVYGRLLISDKPVIYADMTAFEAARAA